MRSIKMLTSDINPANSSWNHHESPVTALRETSHAVSTAFDLEILLQMVAFCDLSSPELEWNWPIPFESPSGGKWAYSEKLKIRMSAMSDPPLVE